MATKNVLLASSLAILALLQACTISIEQRDKTMTETLFTLPENCDFSAVKNNSTAEFECSPKLDSWHSSAFLGILINSPQEVVWPAGASLSDYKVTRSGDREGPLRLMVSGLVRLKYSTMGLRGNFARQVVAVAVDQDTAKVFSGKMNLHVDNAIPRPLESRTRQQQKQPGKLDTSAVQKQLEEMKQNAPVGQHFNMDLLENLGIPLVDASYSVYVTLGDYKSNVLTIKTTLK